MRRIAIINQKGGVGKTTTAVNLGAALARLGRRVVVIDMDPQANASMNLGAELHPEEPSTYSILTQGGKVVDTLRGTSTPGLSILPSHLDLSGAELELASAIGRETVLGDALDEWEEGEIARTGRSPADVILIDNPPSLGLLSVNGLVASTEVLIAVQTEFFALQGLSKLVEIVQMLRRRMNPQLEITGVLACLYDSRLRLAREVLGELRTHFPVQLFKRPIAQNVKLAECPSFSRTIFEYAPESKGADDYLTVAREFLAREGVDLNGNGRAIESTAPPEPKTAAAKPAKAKNTAAAKPAAQTAPAEETPEEVTPTNEIGAGVDVVDDRADAPVEGSEDGPTEGSSPEAQDSAPEAGDAERAALGAPALQIKEVETSELETSAKTPEDVVVTDYEIEPKPRKRAPKKRSTRGEERSEIPSKSGPLSGERG